MPPLTATRSTLAAIQSMKIYQLLLIVTLVATSCKNQQDTKQVQQAHSDTMRQNNAVVSVQKTEASPVLDSFPEFWRKFRAAVISSDMNAVISVTTFPFKTRGPLDDDPIVKYSKEKFITVFQAFLNQSSGLDLEGTTEGEEIKKTLTPMAKDVKGNYARVGDLVFNKNNEGWKLAFAYLDNETIDLLQK